MGPSTSSHSGPSAPPAPKGNLGRVCPPSGDGAPGHHEAAAVREAKTAARARARAWRDALDAPYRHEAALAIAAHVQALLGRLPGRADRLGRQARGVGLYSTLGSEVDTRPLQLWLTRKTYPYALPTVLGKAELGPDAVRFAMVDARTPLTISPLGIAEPHRAMVRDPGCHHRLVALFVPCLAFSAAGVRLGYGRGYYDRLLAHFGGHIIALAYSGQQMDDLVAGPHDVPLHGIVTEHGLMLPPGSPLAGRLEAPATD